MKTKIKLSIKWLFALLLVFILKTNLSIGQSTFFRRYTDTLTDGIGFSILHTSDGGLLLGEGHFLDEQMGPFKLVKTNLLGDTTWTVKFPYPDTSYYSFLKAKETPEKNFIVCGGDFDSGFTVLSKVSPNGTIIWNKQFNIEMPMDMVIASDSGYVMISTYIHPIDSVNQILVIKTDTAGNELWEQIIPSSQYNGNNTDGEYAYSIQSTMDGGYIICAYGSYISSPAYKVIKLDSVGGIQWMKLFASDAFDDLLLGTLSVSESNQGFYYLFSTENNFMSSPVIYCLKLNSNGDSIWAKSYSGNGEAILGWGITSPEGGAILSGITTDDSIYDNGTANIYMFKIDSSGNTIWENQLDIQSKINADEKIWTSEIDTIGNEGFALTGWIYNIDTYRTDMFLLKTNQYGNVLLDSNNVWPGDANSDLIANNKDLLNIGLAYGSIGTIRSGASNNWTGQASADWGTIFNNGIDYKNADCNGDGSINDDDTLAINLNYGSTHNKTVLGNNASASDPDLYLELANDTANTSDTLHVLIKLGTSTVPVTNVYGLAFSINYTSSLVDSGTAKVNFTNSWLGDKTNALSLSKDLYTAGKIDLAFTRKDKQNQSGYGDIGELDLVLEDNISGKDLIYKTLNFTISDVKVISYDETDIPVNLIGDSIVVQGYSSGIIEEVLEDKIKLFPNPITTNLTIELPSTETYTISIFNSIGLLVYSSTRTSQTTKQTVDVSSLPAGVYMLEVKNKNGEKALKKLVKY